MNDPFGFFAACGIKPSDAKKFPVYPIILTGNLTYKASSRYLLGNTPVSGSQLQDIVKDKGNIVIPVYTYIHSITAQSTTSWVGRAPHAEWDSGFSGVWFIPKRVVTRDFHCRVTPKRLALLKQELDRVLASIHTSDPSEQDEEAIEWFRTQKEIPS